MNIMLFYYTVLIFFGLLLLVGAFIGLAYSKKEENEIIEIFQEQERTLTNQYIQPFRMHKNGEIRFQLSAKKQENIIKETTSFRVYLTDLYANIDLDYSYGPRYLEISQPGEYNKTLSLKIGEYNVVFEKEPTEPDIHIKYSLSLNYPQYPYSKYTDWALAFVDIGVSMLLVGLTLYLGSRN